MHAIGFAFARPGGLFADEHSDAVPARGQEICEFRAEPAGGEVRETANLIEFFKGWPGSDNTIHPGIIKNGARIVEVLRFSS